MSEMPYSKSLTEREAMKSKTNEKSAMTGRAKRWVSVGSVAMAMALSACDEPYTTDPGANESPKVASVIIRDAFGSASNLSASERNAAIYEYCNDTAEADEGVSSCAAANEPIFAFNFPFVVFNKLMQGETIENTPPVDAVTNQPLGNCAPNDNGSVTLTVDGTRVAKTRVCYSPSDRLVSVQPSVATDADPYAAFPFLQYESTYNVALTSAIKDKKGAGLAPFSKTFTVRPFGVVAVSDAQRSISVYGAPGTAFEVEEAEALHAPDPTLGEGSLSGIGTVLRVVFSGPVAGATALANAATIEIRNASDNSPVTITSGGNNLGTKILRKDPAGGFNAGRDTRVLYVVPPQYSASGGDDGLPVGDYILHIPVTVTDDSSVTGTNVPLAEAVDVPFSVAVPKK
jgi:hypothetical protein